MTKNSFRKYLTYLSLISFILAFLLLASGSSGLPGESNLTGRKLPVEESVKSNEQTLSIKISESLKFSLPAKTCNLRIWIPLPSTDRYQSVKLLKIESPWSHKIIRDPDFNNKILFIDSNDSLENKTQAIIKWEYKVVRDEQKWIL